MSNMESVLIIFMLMVLFGGIILLGIADLNLAIFNPIRNYNEWVKLNWFGISIITLLLNIIFIPYAIGYWIYKILRLCGWLIYKLFTVGRNGI